MRPAPWPFACSPSCASGPVFADLGGKALSGIEYLTDGSRTADGSAEGGVYRVLDAVPPLARVLAEPAGPASPAGRYARLIAETRDDLLPPTADASDVLVIAFGDFASETFGVDCASRIVSDAVRAGVVTELYGREVGDFLRALFEGADIRLYGRGECHLGMKAAAGTIFVLQDALNTCCYAAHGGTFNAWDSGSRFAVAGQDKVLLDDGETPAQGLKSIHFGTPNEYAFEYLMSGGDNSLHVVKGLDRPDARGELSLKAKPYFGTFSMSAAARRVFVVDLVGRLDPAQYHGNVIGEITAAEWAGDLAPFLAAEAARRGVPLRVEDDEVMLRLQGEWKRWRYDDCFIQLVPQKVSRRLATRGVTPPQLAQLVEE